MCGDWLIESNVSDTGSWLSAKAPRSQIGDDDALVKTMINAEFDFGYILMVSMFI